MHPIVSKEASLRVRDPLFPTSVFFRNCNSVYLSIASIVDAEYKALRMVEWLGEVYDGSAMRRKGGME